MSDRRLHVAYFTPLQPVASGISQYSEDLIPWLSAALDLDVIVDNYTPTLGRALRPARIVPARRFNRRRYDATVLHMGNSPAHNYMVPLALAQPDVLVLHDIVLHHLMVWRAVQGRGGRDGYLRAMRERYGERGAAVAAQVLRGQNPVAMFDFPLNEDLIRAARRVVTHSPSSAAWIERLVPGARTQVVPMGVPEITLADPTVARARLGIPPEAFVILSLGMVNPFKRIAEVFGAVQRIAGEVPDVLVLMVGGDSPNYDVDRLARFAGIAPRVRRLGYVPDDDLPDLFAAADVCVNLRYPTAGETSAAVLRLMSAGLPTIVTDTGAFSDLPDDAVLKVPPTGYEGTMLVAFLRELATNEPFRRALGANARAFVAREHTMRKAAEGYLDVLSEVTERPLAHDLIHAPDNDRSRLTSESGRWARALACARLGRLKPAATGAQSALATDIGPDPALDDDSLSAPVAEAIAALGLADDPHLLDQAARALADIGLGVPKPPRRP